MDTFANKFCKYIKTKIFKTNSPILDTNIYKVGFSIGLNEEIERSSSSIKTTIKISQLFIKPLNIEEVDKYGCHVGIYPKICTTQKPFDVNNFFANDYWTDSDSEYDLDEDENRKPDIIADHFRCENYYKECNNLNDFYWYDWYGDGDDGAFFYKPDIKSVSDIPDVFKQVYINANHQDDDDITVIYKNKVTLYQLLEEVLNNEMKRRFKKSWYILDDRGTFGCEHYTGGYGENIDWSDYRD